MFDLNYVQTTLIESVWFIAYFVASMPSAWLIERIGYRSSLVSGLLIMAAGALGMILASHLPSYGVTLAALFVIASGITLLQVAANPYVAVVGPVATAPSRLNLVQAFNSLGTTLAPLFGGYLILGRSVSGTAQAGQAGAVLSAAQRLADARAVQLPYLIVACRARGAGPRHRALPAAGHGRADPTHLGAAAARAFAVPASQPGVRVYRPSSSI